MDERSRDDFAFYVVGSSVGLTAVFLVLVWLRAPADFAIRFLVAPIVGGIGAVIGLVAFLVERRRIRFGPWRELY
ncbi:MAG: hypothetical protein ACT4OI_02350 [Methanobacteriota archaeon]